MKQKLYTIGDPNKNKRTIQVDVTKVPNMDRKYGYLKNKSQVFDDRRKRSPKYKPNYLED
jgi:hypothetical protein